MTMVTIGTSRVNWHTLNVLKPYNPGCFASDFHSPSHPRAKVWYQGSSTTARVLIILLQYSGTPPYDHPVYKTTSLLPPYSFKPNVKTIDSVYYFEDPVNATTSLLRPGFYGPTVVALTGFHCTNTINAFSNTSLSSVGWVN